MTGHRLPGLDRRAGGRLAATIGIGLISELSAMGLLATGAWLLLSASLRPPILLLSVAIGAVQLFSFTRACARYGERLARHSLGLGFQAGLRGWLYRQLESLVPAGLPGEDEGDLLARLISDTGEAQDLVVRAVGPVLVAVAAWCAGVITAGVLLPAAGWLILAAGLLALAGTAAAVLLLSRRAAALPAARGAVATWVHQMLASADELVALGAEDWALAELDRRERALGARTRAVAVAAGLGRAASMLAGGAGVAGVAWVGAGALSAGRIGPVELGVLVFLALSVAGILQGLPDAAARLPVSQAALRRLAELARLPRPVADPAPGRPGPRYRPAPAASLAPPVSPAPPAGSVPAAGSGPAASPAGTVSPAPAASHSARGPSSRRGVPIVLRDAAVAYPNRPGASQRPVISDVDLELIPGRPVALAGPSGSGKTSLILALLRFIDLTAGQLTVGGTDARALPPRQVRALLAWSPEQPQLFPATLRANLRIGAPHVTDRQISGLLRRLQLGPWLDQLEAGLDTVLAPWAHPVSGGERQRLSVARALLADRPVLVLDEPTSHLDAATAGTVLETVLDHAADRSLLWVTHRLDELTAFPRIHRLEPPAARA